ncbi:MAG: 3-phosphoshikimate 1-carboxyvinyltransferase [Bacteroidetes bacterium]|nr:3-phosphoshikimate 1-carboxyvinyltransferase [Bacteroidota bacterium]
MQVSIQPTLLHGTIQAPASKSSMQRACAAALVSKGKTIIKNPGHSNDDRAALGIIKALGCEWSMVNGEVEVVSRQLSDIGQQSWDAEINCGESGLSIRMFTPIVALFSKTITVNGSGSLATRPMDFFDKVLPQLDVEIISNNGKLPLKIKGPVKPKNIEVDGSLSSQFLTGLLFAYAAADATDVTIRVNNLQSKPYIDLTLKVMRDFGLKVPENRNYEEFYFGHRSSAISHRSSVTYTVEGDWSGGAFLLVAGAVAGNIVVKGLDVHSTQADRKIIEALKDANAKMQIVENEIRLDKSELNAFDFDATDCPDLFPPLVALASYCNGTTTIKGVQRLTHKESNRGLTLQEEFAKFGVEIELQDDIMLVKGNGKLKGTTVHSRHDHRIAMACAVAALQANGETIIEEAEAVNKSYPDFYEHLKLLGASVKTNQLINQ